MLFNAWDYTTRVVIGDDINYDGFGTKTKNLLSKLRKMVDNAEWRNEGNYKYILERVFLNKEIFVRLVKRDRQNFAFFPKEIRNNLLLMMKVVDDLNEEDFMFTRFGSKESLIREYNAMKENITTLEKRTPLVHEVFKYLYIDADKETYAMKNNDGEKVKKQRTFSKLLQRKK